MTNREITLDKAKECVLKDRNTEYGEPEDLFESIADLWGAYLNDISINANDVCLMLGLLKIARAKANPDHMDNYIDLAGYAACASEFARSNDEEKIETGTVRAYCNAGYNTICYSSTPDKL